MLKQSDKSYPESRDFLRSQQKACYRDDVTKWKYFPRYLPFVRGIHRSHKSSEWDTEKSYPDDLGSN